MATELLVENQIDDGKRIVDQLISDGFEVTAAFWVKTAEEGLWHLYIASPLVKAEKPGEAYPALYASLSKIPGLWAQLAGIKLVKSTNPVARGAKEILDRYPARIPTRYRRPQLGGLAIEEAYIYPSPAPKEGWPRLSFRVTYYRQGASNTWRATIERGELYRGISAKGAVSYSTGRWEGENAENDKFAIVSVLLEIDPNFDSEPILELPEVKRMMAQQARSLADEMFKARHPEAVIQHDDQDAGPRADTNT